MSDAEFNYRETRMHVLLVLAYGAAAAVTYACAAFALDGIF